MIIYIYIHKIKKIKYKKRIKPMPRRKKKQKKRPKYTPLKVTLADDFRFERNLLHKNSDLSYFAQFKRSLYVYLEIPKVLSDLISEYAKESKRLCKGLKSLDNSKCMNFALKSKPYCGECNEKIKTLLYCRHGIDVDLCCSSSMCKRCIYCPKECQDKSCPWYHQYGMSIPLSCEEFNSRYGQYSD